MKLKRLLTLLSLAELHALLEELLALVRSHTAVGIEDVEGFTVAKATARAASLAVIAIYLIVAVAVVLIIVSIVAVSV